MVIQVTLNQNSTLFKHDNLTNSRSSSNQVHRKFKRMSLNKEWWIE